MRRYKIRGQHPQNVLMGNKAFSLSEQESRVVVRKPRDAAAVLFGLKFADNIHYKLRVAKLRKPGFRAPNTPAQKRV